MEETIQRSANDRHTVQRMFSPVMHLSASFKSTGLLQVMKCAHTTGQGTVASASQWSGTDITCQLIFNKIYKTNMERCDEDQHIPISVGARWVCDY